MYKEEFISGYCRTQDQSRMVAVEIEDGDLSADCSFGNCPYEDRCTIAVRIRKILENAMSGRVLGDTE